MILLFLSYVILYFQEPNRSDMVTDADYIVEKIQKRRTLLEPIMDLIKGFSPAPVDNASPRGNDVDSLDEGYALVRGESRATYDPSVTSLLEVTPCWMTFLLECMIACRMVKR